LNPGYAALCAPSCGEKAEAIMAKGKRSEGNNGGGPADFTDARAAVKRIAELYDQSAGQIRDRFKRFAAGEREGERLASACYPMLRLTVKPDQLVYDARPSYGTIAYAGTYSSTLTRPDIFAAYYEAQIERLMKYHHTPVAVSLSDRAIPLPFVLEEATANIDVADLRALSSIFTLPDLSRIDDSIANGTHRPLPGADSPLSLFSAERVDLALQRLHHYTGTDPRHFQRFVLFTNYQRYVDAFIRLGHETMEKGGKEDYSAFVEPGNRIWTSGNHGNPSSDRAPLPQMPAYHLVRADGLGVTLVNIGVGPSNAKTITDHIAVLRPHCWIMIGHCGGLRRSQQLGDYVLAHGYVREDSVLDDDVPIWVPVPPIAEVQVALQEAVAKVTGLERDELKTRMRTGTVVTTDDRNWELRYDDLYTRFNQSRAIGIDMESATIAANGLRFRVPYGTLLCVSDKPLHGEIKLRGMANAFYSQRISQHLTIGLEALRSIREGGIERLHSRKLRSFDEPAFQ
jgi:AMP nucleosidase